MTRSDDHATTVSEPDIVRATRAGKISAAGIIAFGIALLAMFQFYLFPLLKLVAGAAPPPNGMLIVETAFVALAGLGIVCGLVMAWYGRKILRSGQCPPADAWLARDTRVRRGKSATRFAWTYIVCGALSCLLCLALAAFVAAMLGPLAHRQVLPQGVTILQPADPGKP